MLNNILEWSYDNSVPKKATFFPNGWNRAKTLESLDRIYATTPQQESRIKMRGMISDKIKVEIMLEIIKMPRAINRQK